LGHSFPGVKRPGGGCIHSVAFAARAKNALRYICSLHVLLGCVCLRKRGNLFNLCITRDE
jgi:hypothetical protein